VVFDVNLRIFNEVFFQMNALNHINELIFCFGCWPRKRVVTWQAAKSPSRKGFFGFHSYCSATIMLLFQLSTPKKGGSTVQRKGVNFKTVSLVSDGRTSEIAKFFF